MDWLPLLIYMAGAVAMALVIRVASPREGLDEGAAFAACLLWPAAVLIGAVGLVAIAWAAIFWPNTDLKAG